VSTLTPTVPFSDGAMCMARGQCGRCGRCAGAWFIPTAYRPMPITL